MTKPPRVFAVQVPARRDGPRGGWVEKFDLGPAERFGEVVRVLPYGNVPEDPEPTVRRLREALADFRPEADHMLLLGDPVALAQAVAVLCAAGVDGFSALKWDRRAEAYSAYRVGA